MPIIKLDLNNTKIVESFIEKNYPDRSHEDTYQLNIEGGSSISRGLIKFDLGLIPNGIIINSAKLTLVQTNVPGNISNLNFHIIKSNWNDKVTWNTAPEFEEVQISSQSFPADKNIFTDVDITQAVKKWINGSLVNNGLLIKHNLENDANSAKLRIFQTQKGTLTSYRITLQIDYTIPENKKYIEFIGNYGKATSINSEGYITSVITDSYKPGDLLILHVAGYAVGVDDIPPGWNIISRKYQSANIYGVYYKFAEQNESNPRIKFGNVDGKAYVYVSVFRNVKRIGNLYDNLYTSNNRNFSPGDINFNYKNMVSILFNSATSYNSSFTNPKPSISIQDSYAYSYFTVNSSFRYLHANQFLTQGDLTTTYGIDTTGSVVHVGLEPYYNSKPNKPIPLYPLGAESAPKILTENNPIFSWNFSDPDPNSYQTAYEIFIRDQSDTLIYDTGKIFSKDSSYRLPDINLEVDKIYYWRVITWDDYGEVGISLSDKEYFKISGDSSLFSYIKPGSYESNKPIGVSLTPLISWDYSKAFNQVNRKINIYEENNLIKSDNKKTSEKFYQVEDNLLQSNKKYSYDLQVENSGTVNSYDFDKDILKISNRSFSNYGNSYSRKIVRLSNGYLVSGTFENGQGVIYLSLSKDNGKTWNLFRSKTGASKEFTLVSKDKIVYLFYTDIYSFTVKCAYTNADINSDKMEEISGVIEITSKQNSIYSISASLNNSKSEISVIISGKNSLYPNNNNLNYIKLDLNSNNYPVKNTPELQLTKITETNLYYQNATIIYNKDNIPFIVTDYYNKGNYSVGYITKSSINSDMENIATNWVGKRIVTSTEKYLNPSIAINKEGIMHLTYQKGENEIQYLYSNDNFSQLNITKIADGSNPSISVDVNGKVFIAFDRTNKKIAYSVEEPNIGRVIKEINTSENLTNKPNLLLDNTIEMEEPIVIYNLEDTSKPADKYIYAKGKWIEFSNNYIKPTYIYNYKPNANLYGNKLNRLSNGYLTFVGQHTSSLNYISLYLSRNRGRNWESYSITNNNENKIYLQSSASYGNIIYTTYSVDNKIYCHYFNTDGQGSNKNQLLINNLTSIDSFSTTISQDGQYIYIAASVKDDINPNYNINFYKVSTTTLNLVETIKITNGISNATYIEPNIILLKNGNPIIFYNSTDNNGKTIKCVMYNGLNWSSPTIVISDVYYEMIEPNAVIDNIGNIHLVYTKSTGFDNVTKIFYHKSIDNGITWTSTQQVTKYEADELDERALITVNNINELFIVYELRNRANNNSKIKMVSKLPNGSWSSPEILSDVTIDNIAMVPSVIKDYNLHFTKPLVSYFESNSVKFMGEWFEKVKTSYKSQKLYIKTNEHSEAPILISPINNYRLPQIPIFEIIMGKDPDNDLQHFKLKLQKIDSNNNPSGQPEYFDSSIDQNGWEYFYNNTWNPFPSSGLDNSYIGCRIRFKMQKSLDLWNRYQWSFASKDSGSNIETYSNYRIARIGNQIIRRSKNIIETSDYAKRFYLKADIYIDEINKGRDIISNNDPKILYNGNWIEYTINGIINKASANKNDYLQLSFKGTGIKIYAGMWHESGLADIYIDGIYKKTIDTYSSIPKNELIYEIDNLELINHEIKIIVKGEKNELSKYTSVIINRFEVLDNTLIEPSLKVEVTNNAFDINPIWEDMTHEFITNDFYELKNKTKTTEKWGLDFKITISANDSLNDIDIGIYGGTFD